MSTSDSSNSSSRWPWRALPTDIWALGFGSLFMDVSSEMIHSLLPIFMVTTLGASIVTVGIIEGIAEATAAILKVFSGTLSDYLGKRKFLMILGYGLAAFTKPIFPLAYTIGWVFTARFVDRIGMGTVVHHAMRWWPTSHPRRCVAQPTGCARRSIRWGHCSARCWRYSS